MNNDNHPLISEIALAVLLGCLLFKITLAPANANEFSSALQLLLTIFSEMSFTSYGVYVFLKARKAYRNNGESDR